MSFYFQNLARASMAAAVLLLGSFASTTQADEWELNTPYYEDDAWYDISEWMDGNDYNPTDEVIGNWDDEVYDYLVDDDDQDNDDNSWGTGYYDSDEGYTDSYHTENVYDYGYHYNDEGELAYGGHYHNWYGFDDRYDDDDWYYDFWDEGYSYFSDWNDDGVYDYSYRYYDYDGDGNYDAVYSSYDWDNDGEYDAVDYYTFADVSDEDKQKSDRQQSKKSKQQQIRGTVVNSKKASVRDTKHLVVQIENKEGSKYLVDLGPAKKLDKFDIEEDSELEARGPVVNIGEKKILIAQHLKMDGESTKIERDRKKVSGQVADTRRSKVRGKKHLIAIISKGNDKKTLVDLGPVGRLDMELEQDDKIEVQGAPVKIDGRKLVMAHILRHDGDKAMIDRSSKNKSSSSKGRDKSRSDRDSQSSQQASKRSSDKNRKRAVTVSGEVVSTQKITVRDDKRQTATIKNRRGDKLLVDLGPAEDLEVDLSKGDNIRARGVLTRAKNGKPVMLARSLKHDGNSKDLARRGASHGGVKQKSISGEVKSLRTQKVRGKSRKFAKLKPEQGRPMLVDLGSPESLDVELSKGDEITARGATVKAGNQLILVAYEVEVDGDTIAVERRFGQRSSSNQND